MTEAIHATVSIGLGAIAIAAMTCAFYGWGRLIRRMTGLPRGTWPVSAALGMAGMIFVGGIFNLCRIAHPSALAGLACTGVVSSLVSLRGNARRPEKAPSDWRALALWCAGVAALMAFVIATQAAPALYNPYDDFQYYFVHAVRMVQTGTLYGSPLNALGGEGLGGQTFLQGFVAGFFPLAYLNSADAVFCFFLCLTLAGSVAFARPTLWPAALAGTAAVFVIDPQYVNTSSLYSTAAMAAALTILSADANEMPQAARWRQAAIPALFYAAMIALKNTGLVFAGLQFVFVTTAQGWARRNWRQSLSEAVLILTWTAIFLAPWALLYAPYYLAGLTHPIDAPLTVVPQITEPSNLLALFSPARTVYGAPLLAYTGLALGLLLCALHCALRARRDQTHRNGQAALAATAAAAAASYFFWVLWGPRLQELTDTLRYSIPVLIGACCVVLPLWVAPTARRMPLLCASLAILVCLIFAPSLYLRVGNLVHQQSQLGFLHNWHGSQIRRSLDFQTRALHGPLRDKVRSLQEKVPPGEAFLAWTATSFLLDYRRNPVIDMNTAGMNQTWAHIPASRYILWQHDGYGSLNTEGLEREMDKFGRRVGQADARGLDMLNYLQAIPASQILADQNDMYLIRLDEKSPPPNGSSYP